MNKLDSLVDSNALSHYLSSNIPDHDDMARPFVKHLPLLPCNACPPLCQRVRLFRFKFCLTIRYSLQPSSTSIVPPCHFDRVDPENNFLPLYHGVEAQSTQPLELRAEKDWGELAMQEARTGSLPGEMLGNDDHVLVCVGIVFVSGRHKVAGNGRIAIIATNVCRDSVKPVGVVVIVGPCADSSVWHIASVRGSRCGIVKL